MTADWKKEAEDAWHAPGWKEAAKEAVKRAAEKTATEDLGAQLAAKLEEQRREQEQETRLRELAQKDPVTYDRHRQRAAKELGIRAGTLDREVEKRRRQPSAKEHSDDGKEIAKFERAAGDLIHEQDILSRFGETVQACGLIGETSNAKILYLAHTSRLFERPVSVAIKGISAGGKSFTVETVIRFFPEEAYFERTGMSEHALPYSNEDFAHRHIIIYELVGMDSDKVSYFIRTLLSENRISYETVEKTGEGLRARVIEKEGPTGIITTTTAATLHPENETRLLSLGVTDSPAQTAAVMKALARRAASGDTPGGDLAEWQAFQSWLALGECRVVIPYAPTIAEKSQPLAVRLRRDLSMLFTLIKAHALLHRSTRATDQHGRITATPADYAAVHDLVATLFAEGVEATVSKTVRETVEAVKMIGQPEVSLTNLAKHLKLEKSTVSARVHRAIARGFLINREEKKGFPARIAVGDPLPEERKILPDPSEVFEEGDCSGVRSESEGIKAEEEIPRSEDEGSVSPEIDQPVSGRLPEATVPNTRAPLYPPKKTSNTRTPTQNGGNGFQPPPLCDHCGTRGHLTPYDWPSRPDGINLHSSCEGPWWDSEGRRP